MINAILILCGMLLLVCLWITEREATVERMEEKIRWYWRHDPRALKPWLDGEIDTLPEPGDEQQDQSEREPEDEPEEEEDWGK